MRNFGTMPQNTPFSFFNRIDKLLKSNRFFR